MRNRFLPFALPDLDEAEIDLVREVLGSGWITSGPKVKEFESAFAERVGARHAVALNSCTAAMHLALEAIGLQPGDEVITSSYTFAATAEVIRYFDAKPILVDVRAGDFNINPDLIEQAITPRTKAIIPVHIAGLPAEMSTICHIANKNSLAVIEDAAHALPASHNGIQIGQNMGVEHGHAVCYSFYATKTLTTAEGGMICTDDDALAERFRVMSLHGISKDAWKRYTAEGSWYYEIVAPGYKYNMTEMAAAMGIAQLDKLDRMWQRRAEIAGQYNEAFATCDLLQIPTERSADQHAWHLYLLRLQLSRLTADRGAFIAELKRHNIGCSVHFIPLHLHPYYRDKYGFQAQDYPVAYGEYQREISLPIYSKMNDQDVNDVIDAVLHLAQKYKK